MAPSIFLAERRVRLFKRQDRSSRYWQAALRLTGRSRPVVKSTGQVELRAAKRWALDLLAHLNGPETTSPLPLLPREDLLTPYPFPHIRQKKRQVEREIALRTLNAYRLNPLIAQRDLAKALNVSLAIVNTYTARCVGAGWLLKLNRPDGRGRGYRYVLTETGQHQLRELLTAYVTQELSLFRTLRADFAVLLREAGDRPILLLGDGDLAAIARLVLAEAGKVPLSGTADRKTTRQRCQHEKAIIWQADLAAAAMADARDTAAPALLRSLGFSADAHVKSKTSV
jgi:DNA-binding MarR family transcriptional regulator